MGSHWGGTYGAPLVGFPKDPTPPAGEAACTACAREPREGAWWGRPVRDCAYLNLMIGYVV